MARALGTIVVAAVLAALTGRAIAAPKMLKGPYLQDLAPTSITVMWQLDEITPGKLIVSGPGGEHAQDVAGARIVEAKIENLAPATRYHYRVEVGDQSWQGEFATAPPVGKDVPFSFVVIGDSRNGVEQHRRVVERMTQEVPDFVLGTGDMVDDGARLDEWQAYFDVESPFLRDNVYYPAVGNHDRQGRGRTADTYRSFFSVPENGGESERYYAFSYAAARFLVLDSNAYSFALTDQTSWIERELIAARQDPNIHHIFVVMHHPPFSISLHGGQRDLRERWVPLFEKYQVTAVFSGHDHVYERAEHNGVRYFVSGGGGAPLYPRRPKPAAIDAEAVQKFERVLHYLRVTTSANRVEVTAIRSDGTTIETTSWTDGPAPVADAPHMVAGSSPPPPVARATPIDDSDDDDGTMLWVAVVGVALVLGTAVIVVGMLRRG